MISGDHVPCTASERCLHLGVLLDGLLSSHAATTSVCSHCGSFVKFQVISDSAQRQRCCSLYLSYFWDPGLVRR